MKRRSSSRIIWDRIDIVTRFFAFDFSWFCFIRCLPDFVFKKLTHSPVATSLNDNWSKKCQGDGGGSNLIRIFTSHLKIQMLHSYAETVKISCKDVMSRKKYDTFDLKLKLQILPLKFFLEYKLFYVTRNQLSVYGKLHLVCATACEPKTLLQSKIKPICHRKLQFA